MSDFWDEKSDVASLLKNIYRCADRSSWYSSVAQAYDYTRPRYPTSIMDRLQEITNLKAGTQVLEIGCGPGIATVDLAKTGIDLICLEPSLPACQIAQKNCVAYSNVEFINSTFENWKSDKVKFDLVIATTSFHWITPGIRTQKIAAALREKGQIALLWNTPPQVSYEIYQSIADIYQIYAPKLSQYEAPTSHYENLSKMGQELINSGLFKDLVEEHVITHANYSVDDYVTLLSTLSPYIKLETEQRNTLLAGSVLDEWN